MGTRNLTVVKLNKKTRVAQYGQWDGYPKGQGNTIATFLKEVDLKEFKKKVKALKVWTQPEMAKVYKSFGAEGEYISCELADKIHAEYPAFERDHGAGILNLIADGTITKVVLNEAFKEDTTFCEYWYEIDLDNETVSMNGGKKYPFKKWTKALMEKLEKAEEEENNK